MNQQAAQKMSRARAELILSQPFFGALALKLKLEQRQDVETLCVDGVTLSYNPDFIVGLSHAETVGVVAHEVMHCAAAHHARRGNRDHETWNEAGDYAINGILDGAGFDLPEGALLDPSYHGQSADEIYLTLKARKPQQPQGGQGQSGAGQGQNQGGQGQGGQGQQGQGHGAGNGATGHFADAPGAAGSEAAAKAAENEWKVATMQAAQAAKAAGKLPAEIAEMIEDMRRPQVDWREVLPRFVSQVAQADYTWSRPNRRFIHMGLHLPSLYSERVGRIGIVVDTSGSVSKEELDAFGGEVTAIAEDVAPEQVRVVYCDTRVQREDVFEDPTDFEWKAPRGGGTNMKPGFARLMGEDGRAEDHEPPICILCLTDLEFWRWPDDPGVPVLWVSTGDDRHADKAPFGETVQLHVGAA